MDWENEGMYKEEKRKNKNRVVQNAVFVAHMLWYVIIPPRKCESGVPLLYLNLSHRLTAFPVCLCERHAQARCPH